MIAHWAESQFFRPMSLYVSGSNLDVLPWDLQADRSRMRGLPEPSDETVRRAAQRSRGSFTDAMDRTIAF